MKEYLPYPFADLALACRLEGAEAAANASFVDTRARLQPESHAKWIEVSGAHAMFDGAESPVTQTFGVGILGDAGAGELEAIEAFYSLHGAHVDHEICPMIDTELLQLLVKRQYHPIEQTSVLYRPIKPGLELGHKSEKTLQVEVAVDYETDRWARVAALGWSEFVEYADVIYELSRISAHRPDSVVFWAKSAGRPIATGALSLYQGVALLAGASTIPEARRQGAQSELLEARLLYAVDNGCDLAMMVARPGSASQRNAERNGFRIAYTRTKWRMQSK